MELVSCQVLTVQNHRYVKVHAQLSDPQTEDQFQNPTFHFS